MSSIRVLKNKIFQKETATAFSLVLNTFVWYLLTYFTFSTIITQDQLKNQSLYLFTAFFIGIAVTAIIGSKVSTRSRDSLLRTWLFLGAIATFLLTMISANNIVVNLLIVSFFGVSIGLGLPSCLSYFAKATSIEKRGLIGGTIWSTVGFVVLILGFLTSMLGTFAVIITLTIWRLIGAVIFLFLNKPHEKIEPQESPSFFTLIRNKNILLYFLPWVMFSLINFAETPMLESFFGTEQFALVQVAEYAFIGIFAFIGGFVADIWGRKRVIIAGFVMLGIEYATLSAFSNPEYSLFLSYIFLTLDGITWGLLFSVFFTVIWGDLGENYTKEKFYALGGIPFLLASFLSILIKPYSQNISLATAFTLASFFLFVAVIPLMYAPETLPEKALKDRDLNSYIKKAKKIAEKNQEQKPEEVKTYDDGSSGETRESPEDKKARELAEKYY
jgi:MFS family permease